MERESLEEFLTPITPTKGSRNKQQSEQDESPSKAQARSRLGSLLGQIRKGEGRQDEDEQQQQTRAEIMDAFDDGLGRRGPGRPKSSRREKRVVFELRGKPFGLRDSGSVEPIYSLCRKWMYGKDDDQPEEEDLEEVDPSEFDDSRFKSLDLLATREIHALPAPDREVPLMDPRPAKVLQMQAAPDHLGTDKLNDQRALLGEYKRHWKGVKKNWMAYNQKRQQRYADSLQLLRTVYGIAQQNQI